MDIKLFAKNEKEFKKKLIQAVKLYSLVRGMEFGIEKCVMLIMSGGKGRKELNYQIKTNLNAQRKGNCT